MTVAVLVARLALAAVFSWAATAKLLAPERWKHGVRQHRFRREIKVLGILTIPWAELSAAVLLVAGAPLAGAAIATALLVGFSAALVRLRILARTNAVPCGCFGGVNDRDYRLLLIRNAVLLALAGLAVLPPAARGSWWPSTSGPTRPVLVVLATLWLLAAAGWAMWQAAGHAHRREAT